MLRNFGMVYNFAITVTRIHFAIWEVRSEQFEPYRKVTAKITFTLENNYNKKPPTKQQQMKTPPNIENAK